MFEKFNQFAETAAKKASRRQFLGRLGRAGMTAALATGGLLAMTQTAMAARKCPPGYKPCPDPVSGGKNKWCCPTNAKKTTA